MSSKIDREIDAILDRRSLGHFPLYDSISSRIRRAHFMSEALYAAATGEYDVTTRQVALLTAAFRRPGCTINALADSIALDRQSTAEMTHRLVKRGLLERRRMESDVRAYAITVSEEGKSVLSQVLPLYEDVESALFDKLPEEYRLLFMRCLDLILNGSGSDAVSAPASLDSKSGSGRPRDQLPQDLKTALL